MARKPLAIGTVLLLAALMLAAHEGPRSTSESCTDILGSEVCTWVELEGRTVVEMGADIPLALVERVPADAEMTWPPESLGSVALPAEARLALGIDHMAINWEAHGHPPASFMVQHFDFHFYSITPREVEAIDCSDGSKPSRLPTGYSLPDIDAPGLGTLVGLCVPRMGMHAMPSSDAAATDAFEASMIVGYYERRPIFFEPMVSRDLLLARSNFDLALPGVYDLPAGVVYPTEFRAEYDAVSDRYRLVFGGFARD